VDTFWTWGRYPATPPKGNMMNIDTACYGYLTTEKQKRRFYRVKKLEKMAFWFYTKGWYKTRNVLHHYVIVSFGKWYISF
jgi:hypothetical protein